MDCIKKGSFFFEIKMNIKDKHLLVVNMYFSIQFSAARRRQDKQYVFIDFAVPNLIII